MEQVKQTSVPEFIETNLQLTKHRFKIPTYPNKEFRSSRRDIIRFTIELVIGKKKDGKHVQYSLEHIKKACS